ncbi:hypothetical protein IFT48_00860 [Pseudomonas fluorescens]|uniref:hypothetical protein n=1 Tax=Pseudomonas TaxID=286 RepID=UPI000F012338|nr:MULTISPECIES: hypothetical protein [Pseudomonas]MBD8088542.1 hypothetical protein [Pseudomonas fluorescens]MBD8614997.1 hypothetical protein [Pseudomonas putida]MBD8681320.1 hypothetical protein [Pseudomonas sp. CFBP 13719]
MNWHLIDSVSLDKPVYGDPCNGCGVCCIAKVCELGEALGDDQNCKALIQNTDRSFSCGLVVDPYRFLSEESLDVWQAIDAMSDGNAGEQALRESNAQALGAGRGCDSDDDAAQEYIDEARAHLQLSLSLV